MGDYDAAIQHYLVEAVHHLAHGNVDGARNASAVAHALRDHPETQPTDHHAFTLGMEHPAVVEQKRAEQEQQQVKADHSPSAPVVHTTQDAAGNWVY